MVLGGKEPFSMPDSQSALFYESRLWLNRTWSGIQQIRIRRAQGHDSILTGMTTFSEWGSSLLWGLRKPISSCAAIEQHFPLAEPKGHISLSLLPASSPHQHPITSRASLLPLTPLPNSCLLRSRVLFWFTAHLAGAQGPSWGQEGKIITMKDRLWAKGQESLLKR